MRGFPCDGRTINYFSATRPLDANAMCIFGMNSLQGDGRHRLDGLPLAPAFEIDGPCDPSIYSAIFRGADLVNGVGGNCRPPARLFPRSIWGRRSYVYRVQDYGFKCCIVDSLMRLNHPCHGFRVPVYTRVLLRYCLSAVECTPDFS